MLNRTAHVLGLFSQKYIINMHTKGMLKWWSITEILDTGRFAWCHRFSLYLTFHLWPDGSPRTARHRLVTWFDNVPQKGGRRGEGQNGRYEWVHLVWVYSQRWHTEASVTLLQWSRRFNTLLPLHPFPTYTRTQQVPVRSCQRQRLGGQQLHGTRGKSQHALKM